MAATINRLTDRGVKAQSKVGYHADGGGLYLVVTATGSKSWSFIFQWGGKRKEMGLGSVQTFDLKEARDAALAARKQVAVGVNPIEARKQAVIDQLPAEERTFGAVLERYLKANEERWKNGRYAASWRRMLETRVAAIRDKDVAAITIHDVEAVLRPIWNTMPPTAFEIRARIRLVLDAAKAWGLRTADNPDSKLSVILGAQKHEKTHYPAMPYADIAAFVQQLQAKDTVSSLALEFTILTGVRSAETLGATWREISFTEKLWVIPEERMKAGKEHHIPLSDQAMKVLERALKATNGAPDEYVFPGGHIGRRDPDSPMAHPSMWNLMQRLLGKNTHLTVHGFRSAFSDWAADETDYSHELVEVALAHVTGSQVARAYRRTNLMAKRRLLMQDWGTYVAGQGRPEPSAQEACDQAA